ncbi:sulfotransferase family protein [Flexivirga oryzae]|uniref:Sulfotransferase n=1 Tax=Flexivirga oryzae TaxID=1794944 RepID=A0A839MXR7_9MICO|nr:sulfotransferase [Flexivirga oryzae]MBB2890188.1 hypothetical protein [Flexivirga oryzae]
MSTRRIILIGAARSGTKIIRDSLANATDIGSVPYDINFVWRYGNESMPDDTLSDVTASVATRRFITKYVDRYANNGVVLEKTVSNSLRIPFVQQIFPDATFIHLIRDGIDAIGSTRSQWLAPTDKAYMLRKLRHFPPRLLPSYGRKFAMGLLARQNREAPRATWGVRYAGIDEDLKRDGLLVACAQQWRYSVESALTALDNLDLKVINVRYEELVAHPGTVLGNLAKDLDLSAHPSVLGGVESRVTDENVGKGSRQLSREELIAIGPIVDPTLERLGYKKVVERIRDDHASNAMDIP